MSQSDARKQGANAPEGIILGPGEGRTIGGITLKATAEETGGSIGVLEATSPPGAGPPRHVHYGCDELFYVLEGQFLFLVGERQVSAPPGTFV
ncbi:MAG: cupin domain-containing protein, partial [Actinomycetota bacterium]|nr:cupin domain-containing protein [Actinomycetota bacterium]